MMSKGPTRLLLATSLASSLFAAGCDDDAEAVVSDWNEAGLEVGPMEAMEAHDFGEAKCSSAKAAGVDATLCVFENEKAAEAARTAGLASIGDHTGAALIQGAKLLVVADRDNKDPEGKTIQTLTSTFMGKK